MNFSGRRTARPEPGDLLHRQGAAPHQVLLLLEGPVALQVGHAKATEGWAPLALGLEAGLGGSRQGETAWAGEGAVCLAVGGRDLLGLLGEEIALARAIFRALLEDSGANGWVLDPRRAVDAPGGTHAQTLEAVHVLEASPLFARATGPTRTWWKAPLIPTGLLSCRGMR